MDENACWIKKNGKLWGAYCFGEAKSFYQWTKDNRVLVGRNILIRRAQKDMDVEKALCTPKSDPGKDPGPTLSELSRVIAMPWTIKKK